ncbi:MAG: NAD(P)-dependent alcohol dehydrogenase [Calditrichaeota bacterium]|nr:NAD(P)-dependent alcohol dehydrogenase [Calditrichota bacterium]
MKAFTSRKYGGEDVLKLEELPIPEPKDNEVLIKVHAASVNAADWHTMRAEPFMVRLSDGFLKPKHIILGADVAGTIEAVGKDVTHFKPGDEVYGDLAGCGFGTFAEYVCATENYIAPKPTNLSYEEAAAVPLAGVSALQGLRKAGIAKGKTVLINGASGGVGTFAIQIAKSFETEVTAVCSTRNMEQARALGADHVMDYTKEDFTQSGKQYDIIFAANGYHPLKHYKRALTSTGHYVMIGGAYKQIFGALFLGSFYSMFGSKKMEFMVAKCSQQDLRILKDLIETNRVKPIISHRYDFAGIPQAVTQLYNGHTPGKAVVSVV